MGEEKRDELIIAANCWNRRIVLGDSMSFHEFPWVSMRFYAHAPRRLQKILHVQSYKVIFQLFPEGSILLRCI